jgi:hypothetical protein
MSFPTNPTDGQTTIEFGRTFVYRSSSSTWMPVSSPSTPTVRESIPAPVVVANAADLPMVGNTIGRTGYVSGTNRLYIWNGSGWFEIALVNTNPTITDSGLATYELNIDGTPTVITLAANDPEGLPLTWSYAVSSGALEDTTVTNADNVFTVTPGTVSATFDLTFTASDGVNIDTSVSTFSLSIPDWSSLSLTATISNPEAIASSFGVAMAENTNYIIIGDANYYPDTNNLQSGRVYVYNKSDNSPAFTISNQNFTGTQSGDIFGFSVAATDNLIAVGAPQEDAVGTNTGCVYLYNASTGAYITRIDDPNEVSSTNDFFGNSLAFSQDGTRLIVGAPYEGTSLGRVYIFDSNTRAKLYSLVPPPPYNAGVSSIYLGERMSAHGNYLLLSSYITNTTDGTDTYSGVIYIYNAINGNLIKTIDNPNSFSSTIDDRFGWSIAINGNYLIVGAPYEDLSTSTSTSSGTYNAGKAYIYKTDTGDWSDAYLLYTLQNSTKSASDDRFGSGVWINSTHAIVAAMNDDAGGFNKGKLYVYELETGSLVESINPPASSKANGYFGLAGNGTQGSLLTEDNFYATWTTTTVRNVNVYTPS